MEVLAQSRHVRFCENEMILFHFYDKILISLQSLDGSILSEKSDESDLAPGGRGRQNDTDV